MIDITDLDFESIQQVLEAGMMELTMLYFVEVSEVKKETDKAVLIEGHFQVPNIGNTRTGRFDGLFTATKWIPKSQIKGTAIQDGKEYKVLSNWIARKIAQETNDMVRR